MNFKEEKCKTPERVCGYVGGDDELLIRGKCNEVRNSLDNGIKKPHNMNIFTMFGKIIIKIRNIISKI